MPYLNIEENIKEENYNNNDESIIIGIKDNNLNKINDDLPNDIFITQHQNTIF